MKFMSIILSAVLALSATNGFALEQNSAPMTVKQILAQQHAELKDLRIQIRHARTLRAVGTVGIVVSSAALAGGIFLSQIGSFAGKALNEMGNLYLGGRRPDPVVSKDALFFLGSSAGLAGSVALVIVESRNLDKLEEQIEKLEAEIKSTYEQLPQ